MIARGSWHSLRRFLVLLALSFSFGGFVFYAGVVVPAGTSVLGSTTQGFVTRLVTKTLNTSVLLTALLLWWELAAAWSLRSRRCNNLLFGLVALISFTVGILVYLHAELDAMLLPEAMSVEDSEHFYGLHRVYLWTSTIQWLCSLPVLWIVANSGMFTNRTSASKVPDNSKVPD